MSTAVQKNPPRTLNGSLRQSVRCVLLLWAGIGCSIPPCERAQACCRRAEALVQAEITDTTTISDICEDVLEEESDERCDAKTEEVLEHLEAISLTSPDDCL